MAQSRHFWKWYCICFFICQSVMINANASDYHSPIIGARSIGMGGASVGSVIGGEALYWNPAAMAWNDGFHLFGNYGSLIDQYSNRFIGITYSFSKHGVLGVGFHGHKNISSGRDSSGVIIGYARSFVKDEIALGITFQGYTTSESVKIYRVTAGLHYKINSNLMFGTVVQSRGTFGESGKERVRIPYHAKTGFMYRPISWITMAFDVELSRIEKDRGPDEVGRANYGLEIKLPTHLFWQKGADFFDLFLRCGTRSGITESTVKGDYIHWTRPWSENGLSLGIGLNIKKYGQVISLDFACDEFGGYFGALSIHL